MFENSIYTQNLFFNSSGKFELLGKTNNSVLVDVCKVNFKLSQKSSLVIYLQIKI